MNINSNNIFLLTYNHLNDLVNKCINEHKDHKYPDGIICDTRYIAEITHKIHKNVLRDIDDLMKNLNNQGRRTFREVAKSEPVAENQGESNEVSKFEESSYDQDIAKTGPSYGLELAKSGGSLEKQDEINLKYEFRIIEYYTLDKKGEMRNTYMISPVAFLVLMGRYNDTISYCLANFFYNVMKKLEMSIDKLLNTNLDVLDEASELAYYRDSDDPVRNQMFIDNLPRYLALYGNKTNIVEAMSGIKQVNKNDFCYATTLDVWKITGKTEHNKITRDIKSMLTKLKQDGFDADAHFVETYRKLENNRNVKVFEMDEIGFITIMSKYYSWILYDLSKFYISMKDNIEISAEGLLSIKKEILLEAYEIMKDIAIIKSEEQERAIRNMFSDIDYPNMTDEEIAKETERIHKENTKRINELKDNFKQKYDNKNILN